MRRVSLIIGMVGLLGMIAFGQSAVLVAATPRQQQSEPTLATLPGTPTTIPTPTARPADIPVRVGIQVGHWKSSELPEELARLRTSTGAFANGLAEVDLNLAIAQRVEKLLTSRGILVDLLPATVPPSYDADAFVALHADGSASRTARGYKLATPWRTSRASQLLAEQLDAAYLEATKLPRDGAITVNMRGYYAFNYRRHTHAIARTTPAAILEMGFLTSAADRAVMYGKADAVATGIANGIINYLNMRDPNDGAALLPPEYPVFRPATDGVAVHAAPNDQARVLLRATQDQRIFVFQERGEWFEVVVRGEWRVVGWVRRDALVATNDAPPTPPPASDS
ncbi:MAG: N-acetylmuramoyl-L-alanine amidase [Roseiflexaceae bacterium]